MISVRLESEVRDRLEALAQDTGRSRSYLAAEAIAGYLDVNEWQVAGIKSAIASIEDSGSISSEDIEAWVASWDSGNKLPQPKPEKP